MLRTYPVLLALASFAASPALADLVDVTFGGGAGGSGSIVARCFTSPDCADQEFLSFNGTNNNQDNFSASGSVTAAGRVTLSGLVQQTTDVSPTSFSVDLQTLATLGATGLQWGASVNITNSYFLQFTLTTESLMHLSEFGNSFSPQICLLYGANLDPSIPCLDGGSFNQSFTLGPGTYGLSLGDQLIAYSFNAQPLGTHDEIMDQLVLTADFTAVPEPRWSVAILAGLLMAIAGSAPIRRGRRA